MKILLVLALSFVVAVQSQQDACSLPSDSGFCRAYFPSYYYNSKTGQCEFFIYGGCGGNNNRFNTIQECEAQCGQKHICTLPSDPGYCRAYFPSYYYNSASGRCEFFVYGGCGGNSNRFNSPQECEDRCLDICSLPSDPGYCRASFPSYYYNGKSGQCEFFIYGGCGGNKNRFVSKQDCENRCGQKNQAIVFPPY